MHILGLPGNPVSSYVCAFLFLIPLIRRMSGRADLTIPVESAVLGADLPANDEREDYLRASLRHTAAGDIATPYPVQDSSMMVSLANADCLVIREPYAPAASVGSRCAIVKFGA
jgi:molybdopterin molybdotransferase